LNSWPTAPTLHYPRTIYGGRQGKARQGKAFADGVEDPAIKIQLLLGGEKMMNKALRQALELQTVLLAA
jgi:hypothetical protein